MRHNRYLFLIALLSLSLWIVGCSSESVEPQVVAAKPPAATSVPPTATSVPPTATSVPPTATSVPPTATSVPPTATAVPPTATPIPIPSADLFTSFSACGWDSSYAIDNGSLFLSSTETPGSQSVGNLNLDFMPALAGQTHSNLKNQSLGFALHEYTRIELDINKGIPVSYTHLTLPTILLV